MNKNEVRKTGPIGLDVGTSRIVSARQAEQGFAFESQLNAFVGIPHSRMTESALTRERVPYVVEGDAIVVHGNESERFAGLLHTEVRRPMTRGMLNAAEPDSLKLIQQIAASLLGGVEAGQKVCFTIPAAPLDAEQDLTYHEASLRQILTGMGCEATSIN